MPAGGKGMDMAAILAAARAGKSAAPAAAPAAKPAPKKEPPVKAAVAEKPAAKAAPAKPAGDGNGAAAATKDTASILAAARKGAKPGPMTKAEAAALAKPAEPVAKKKLDVPPMPAKPDYAKPRPAIAAAAQQTDRRSFLSAAAGVLFGSSLAIGFTSLAATHLMWGLGLARFMFPNILIEPPTRFKVGFPDTLAPGQVETKFIAQFGVWVVKYEFEGQAMVYALKSVCTHLGCTPNWLEAEQKFKCPCHGSGFYKDGVNFEGPAPRPLERYAISLADDGQLLVDKSRTFQEEMGQWKDPASFVPV
jgi:cytochrome b6-f complex iron-sulfur subunit